MSEVSLLYTTFPDETTAKSIAHTVVTEKLAACANMMPPMVSIYEWDGKIEESSETAILFKTTSDRSEALIARIAALHPYEVPAIIGWPAGISHAPFADWVIKQTK